MKVGVISDTHDDMINTNIAIDIFKESNVKVVISRFAGIFTGTRVIWEQTILPFLLLKDDVLLGLI